MTRTTDPPDDYDPARDDAMRATFEKADRAATSLKPESWHRGMGNVSYGAAYGAKPWRARRVVKDKNGKRIKAEYRYFATQQEAWNFLQGQQSPVTSKMTVDGMLNAWLASSAVTSNSPATVALYTIAVRKYLAPHFAGMPTNALTIDAAQRFFDNVKLATNKKKAPSTPYVHRLFETFRTCIRWAQPREYIEKNPLDNITLAPLSSDKFDTWTKAQVEKFFAALDNEPAIINAYFRLLATTGLRRGEGRGLRWSDITADGAWVRLAGQVQELNGQHYKESKNKHHRMISLDASVRALLPKIERRSAYIFTTTTGSPLRNKGIREDLDRIINAAGLPRLTAHDLRHTFATRLAEEGYDRGVIADALGATSQTADRYVKRGSRNMLIAEAQRRLFS